MIYRRIVICFPSCVCVLQNKYVSVVKSFKYNYLFSESLDRWVSGRLVGWSVVCGFNKTQGKNKFGAVISPVHFDRGLFCYSNFNFSYIKEETNLTARSSHSNRSPQSPPRSRSHDQILLLFTSSRPKFGTTHHHAN